jgi:ribosomal silencing factor RsfS
LIVIVGLDSDKNLREMADTIGAKVYLDPSGDAIRKLGGSGVPHWYVLDSGNKIIRHFGGSYSSLEEQLNQLGF